MNFKMHLSLLLFSLSFTLWANDTADKQPNVLFIMVDDLRPELGAFGNETVISPNIDKLAAGGMRFENVYCMPQCTPTRATLLTGQYPCNNGWVNHWDGYKPWKDLDSYILMALESNKIKIKEKNGSKKRMRKGVRTLNFFIVVHSPRLNKTRVSFS